jgi:WD40 repeat protein
MTPLLHLSRFLPRVCLRHAPRLLLTLLLLTAPPESLLATPLVWGVRQVDCITLDQPSQTPPTETPSSAAQPPIPPPITTLAFTAGGQTLWTASLSGIDLWSWPQLTHRLRCNLDGDHVTRLRGAPDNQHLVAVGGSPGESGKIWRFEATGQLQWQQQLSDDMLTDVAWSQDGRYLAATDLHGQLHWLLAETGAPLAPPASHAGGLLGVACLPGDQVVVGGLDHSLQLHTRIGSPEPQRGMTQHTGPVVALESGPSSIEAVPSPMRLPPRSAAGSPWLVSIGGDRTVRLWQPLLGRLVRFYRLPAAQPTCLAWSEPHGGILVGDSSGQLSMIEPASGRLRWSGSVGDSWHFAIAPHPTTAVIVFGATRGRIFVAHLTAPQHEAAVP